MYPALFGDVEVVKCLWSGQGCDILRGCCKLLSGIPSSGCRLVENGMLLPWEVGIM